MYIYAHIHKSKYHKIQQIVRICTLCVRVSFKTRQQQTTWYILKICKLQNSGIQLNPTQLDYVGFSNHFLFGFGDSNQKCCWNHTDSNVTFEWNPRFQSKRGLENPIESNWVGFSWIPEFGIAKYDKIFKNAHIYVHFVFASG